MSRPPHVRNGSRLCENAATRRRERTNVRENRPWVRKHSDAESDFNTLEKNHSRRFSIFCVFTQPRPLATRRLRMAERRFRRKAEMALLSGHAPLPAALDDRREQQRVLHREGCCRASARLFLFRGRAWSAISGQAADQGRGPPHGGELRQAAGAVARNAAHKQSVTRCNRHASRQSAQCPLIVQLRKYRCIAASDVMGRFCCRSRLSFSTNSDSVAATLTSAGANDNGAAQSGSKSLRARSIANAAPELRVPTTNTSYRVIRRLS